MFIKSAYRGLTLIELIVFIVIVSTALAGVLTVFNVVTKNSADPVRAKQALAVAEALMDEILNKRFSNPSGGYAADCINFPTTKCDRTQFDDVADYAGYSRSGVVELPADTGSNASALPALSSYAVAVSVSSPGTFSVSGFDDVSSSNCLKVKVVVTDAGSGGTSYTLTAYAFNNDDDT